MRIAICEDLQKDRDRLTDLISDYINANGLEAEIDMFTSGEALLEAFLPGKYQMLFQDVYLDRNGINGVQATEKIRETDSEVSIIFTTTNSEIGPASYDVSAAYYIIKPVEKDNLRKAMDKCRVQLDRYAKTIEVTVNRQPTKIRLRDICYVEVFRHNTLLHMTTGEVKTSAAFSELSQILSGGSFLLCHRSFIVNFVHVANMQDKDFIMKNGVRVPISNTYLDEAKKTFQAYFWED